GKADDGGNIGASQSAPANPFSANRAPVPAFSAYEISSWLPTETTTIAVTDTLPLDGHAADDGRGTLSLSWSKVSGPGNVTFTPLSEPGAVGPAFAYVTASFSAAGTYVIQLQATDGQAIAARQATVYVGTAPAGTGSLPTPTG